MPRMTHVSAALACVFVLGAGSDAYAERYALLVGVGKYAASASHGATLDLEGPAQDVPALRRVLVEQRGFSDGNIVALVDEAATRQAILDRLAARVASMRDGDYLVFYFSGHGTSAFDAKMRPVSAFIGPNSGALVPYDFQTDSAEHAASSLLIGRRDLRPILERLPKGSQALVILDACYSENSVRSIRQRLSGKTRGITLGTVVGSAGSSTLQPTAVDGAELSAAALEAERAYPYANVVALTAASKDEQAVDIDSRTMVDGRYPTVDGKPHGAFTNSLLEGLSGAGDGNHDGTITLQELYEFSRLSVQARFSHTPQLLVPAAAALAGVPALGSAPRVPAATACGPDTSNQQPGPIQVRLENVEDSIAAGIRAARDIQVVSRGGDLVIAQGPGGLVDLYDAAGSLVRQFRSADVAELMTRVRAEPGLKRFVAFRLSCQAFTTTVQLQPKGQSRFSAKDRMDIEAYLERDAYLALFNVDKSGSISLVYPRTPAERGKKAAGQALKLASVRAVAPFGSEYLKVVAFAAPPSLDRIGCQVDANGNLGCPDIQPGSPAFEALLGLLDGAAAAESHIRFTTYEE